VTRAQSAAIDAVLEADEEVLCTISAVTGLLALPFVVMAPIIGSKRWKLAVTNRRFIAVETPFFSTSKRTPLSIPLVGIEEVRVEWSVTASAIVTVEPDKRKFKIVGFPTATHDFLGKLRAAVSAEKFHGSP
jgi:hypothetical protein